MSRERLDEALNDADAALLARIDRDVARALSVEPSPDFIARVRLRVGEERPACHWHGLRWRRLARRSLGEGRPSGLPSWRAALIPAGALAAIAIAAAVLMRQPEIPARPANDTAVSSSARQAPPAVAPPETPPRTATAAAPRTPAARAPGVRSQHPPTSSRHAAPPARAAAEPEVLVPPDQDRAIRELMAALRDGRVDPTAIVALEAEQEAHTSTRRELIIPPLKIDPLPAPPPIDPAPGSGR